MRTKIAITLLALVSGAILIVVTCQIMGDLAETRGDSEANEEKAVALVDRVMTQWVSRCERMNFETLGEDNDGKWVEEFRAVFRREVPRASYRAFMLALTDSRQENADDARHEMAVMALVEFYAQRGNRPRLVETLSRFCPDRFCYMDIEQFLALHAQRAGGITVLFDAYDRAENPLARERITTAIARAFRADGLNRVDADETVKACREWYEQNERNLCVNAEYGNNGNGIHNAIRIGGMAACAG